MEQKKTLCCILIDGQSSEPSQESIPEEKSSTGADNSNNAPQTGNMQLPPSNNTNVSILC